MKRSVLIVLLLALAVPWLAFGQAHTAPPPKPGPEVRQPVMDAIPEGQALVYVFNASGRTLISNSQGFKANGRDIAKLARQEYAVVAFDPGTYGFEAGGRRRELALVAAQNYFLVYAYHPGKSWASPLAGQAVFFDAVTEDQARDMLGEYRRTRIDIR